MQHIIFSRLLDAKIVEEETTVNNLVTKLRKLMDNCHVKELGCIKKYLGKICDYTCGAAKKRLF